MNEETPAPKDPHKATQEALHRLVLAAVNCLETIRVSEAWRQWGYKSFEHYIHDRWNDEPWPARYWLGLVHIQSEYTRQLFHESAQHPHLSMISLKESEAKLFPGNLN